MIISRIFSSLVELRIRHSRLAGAAVLVLVYGFCRTEFASAQMQPRNAPAKAPVKLISPVKDKNFYLLSLLERDPSVRTVIDCDNELAQIRLAKSRLLSELFEYQSATRMPAISRLEFSESEIAIVKRRLSALYETSSAMRRLVDGKLRASGFYIRYQAMPGSAMIAHAWTDCARAINHCVDVYGLGKAGRSPAIDGISYDLKSETFVALVQNVVGLLQDDIETQKLWFQPTLGLSLGLMELNRRDEAGRLEPLELGENRAALRRIPSIDWSRYRYSVIIIPGFGPDERDIALSPIGKLGLRLAVRRYRDGLAPLILVSGGYVHPKQTAFCEALNMKHVLRTEFGIPERSILIDPHARHTTTNLRNAARLIYRYGIPFNQLALITTNTYQSAEIEAKDFQERCQGLFGYQPVEIQQRIGPFDLPCLPKIDSLYADPMDPLDP